MNHSQAAMLCEQGLITSDQLAQIQLRCLRTGETESEVLQALGITTDLAIHPSAAGLINEPTARCLKVVPLRKEADRLYLAMADPRDVYALDEIRLLTGLDVTIVPTDPQQLDNALDRLYRPQDM